MREMADARRSIERGVTVTGLETQAVRSDTETGSQQRLIEIGWILAGRFDERDQRAAVRCRDAVRDQLASDLPEFDWHLPLVHYERVTSTVRAEPIACLEQAAAERNLRQWDFTVLITTADLISHYRAEAMLAVSRSLAGVVVSTAGAAGDLSDVGADAENNETVLVRRLRALVLHGLGHLNGLKHHPEDTNWMFSVDSPEQLNRLESFDDPQRERLAQELADVADQRLEEDRRYRSLRPGLFYLLGTWVNRQEIFKALIESKPWYFPLRFGRLTAAAVSGLLVLVVTAEVWELAAAQAAAGVAGLSAVAVLATTIYILFRQRLFVRRKARLNELTVVTNVSALAIVLTGMATTYIVMVAVALLVGGVLFPPELLQRWMSRTAVSIGLTDYLQLACFTAALSIFIGALGSSFERHSYFRHVIFIDEEL
jgi:predicted Zn-dependent protease